MAAMTATVVLAPCVSLLSARGELYFGVCKMSQLVAVTESEIARAYSVSIDFLRKDRRTKRLIPFFRMGRAIRYDLDRVREALIKREEGGTK
jgi:hypothetical protein